MIDKAMEERNRKKLNASNKKRLYARVYGRVQGVGFRYSTIMQGRKFNLTGYAKNMDDGSVEVVAEGNEEILKKFLTWLKKGPSLSRVDKVDYHFIPYKGYYRTFGVEY
jgi:acylphosphatase